MPVGSSRGGSFPVAAGDAREREVHVMSDVDPVTARRERGRRATGASPVRRDSPLPLWAQVHDDLRHRLTTGEFADAFPGELALVDEYGVSRHTVREALRRLRSEGLVVAQRGRRPRLANPPVIDQPLGALYSLFSSVEATGAVQRSVVRALDVRVDDDAALQLEVPDGSELLYLERIRLADDEPLAVDRIWLPAARTKPLLDVDFTHTALYTELAARCGVRLSSGCEQIRAVIPSEEEREDLDLPEGVAAFAIDRVGEYEGSPFEWRRTLVRADRFELSARVSPGGTYKLDMGEASRQ